MDAVQDELKYAALTYLCYVTKDPDLVEESTGWYRTFSFQRDNEVAPSRTKAKEAEGFHRPEDVQSVKNAWDQLMLLSVEGIEQELEAWKQQKWQEELDSFLFNQPDAMFIDMNYWARVATWTDEQAAMLSLNRHPLEEYLNSLKELTLDKIQKSEVAKDFFDRVALAKTAREAGQISKVGKSLDFVEWFEQMDFETRPDLIEKVRYYQGVSNRPTATDGDMSDREKQTALKLIAAMAVRGYSYDPANQRNASTADIRSDLELLGLTLDNKTILKWLRASTDLVDASYWKRD